ncbi:MAG: ABC transporter substrate-binding protein [Thermoprotei archaeon]
MQKIYSLLIAAIFLLSAVVPAAASSAVLQPSQVSTYGPLVNEVIYQQMSDSSAFLALESGKIQAMEWPLTLSNYKSALTNTKLYTNSTPSYTFEGIAFNFLQPPMNNIHFRRAMAYLTNYTRLQSDLGAAVIAGPQLYNPTLYSQPFSAVNWYDPTLQYPYKLNTTAAIDELLKVPGMSYNKAKGQWYYNGSAFTPTLYYRTDDPIRTTAAQDFAKTASEINLTIDLVGVTDLTASGEIYSPASAAVISPGVMGSNLSTIKPPVFNYTYAKTNDKWDMYTFGWIVSANPNWPDFFFTSEYAGIVNFGNYYDPEMDYWGNVLYYGAANISIAQEAAWNIQKIFYQDLPYIIWFYEPQLYSVYTNGWSGYALIPTTGPSTSTGLYYTLLNVHPTGQPYGGTFTEALHGVPTSLDPLYQTNWVWQIDVWQEVYDSPLGTPPTGVTSLSIIPWMATYSIQNDTTVSLGNGKGWWNPFNASKIVKGQVITLNFFHNLTWQDGVPITAYDYNFSLYYWNYQGLTGAATPNSYASTPPYGLLATYIPPNNPYEIQLYVNSTNLWNIYTLDTALIPEHIFKYFNPAAVASSTGAMDTTVPASQISGLSGYLASNTTKLPEFIYWLPNLEVGSGPFTFVSWNKVSNVITLVRNIHYYRTAWWAFQSSTIAGNPFVYTTDINETIYNPTSSTFEGVPAGGTGTIPITNATGYVEVLSSSGAVLAKAPLQGGANGVYTATIDTSSLAPGLYELFTNATYTSFGLQRYWYTFTGLNVRSAVAKVSAPTLSSSSVTKGQPVTISAEAISYTGAPLAGQTIVFVVNGTQIGENATNANGIATIKYTPSSSGKFSVSVYALSNSSVVSSPAQLTVTSPTNYTLYAAIVIIIVIIVVAVILLLRRKPSAKGSSEAQPAQK